MQGPATVRENNSGTGDKANQIVLSGEITQSFREIALSSVQIFFFFCLFS